MPQIIQFKKRIPGTGAPASGTGPGEVTAGEPAVSITAAGVADLYIGDGAAVRTLVSATRQVELTGNQDVGGVKTFTDTSIRITGGDDDDALFLKDENTGELEFRPISPGGLLSVNVSAPITGNGTSGSALAITRATDAQIAAGTNNVNPIDSLGLHDAVLGDVPAALDVPAGDAAADRRVIPAINELFADIGDLGDQLAAISGALRFVGNFDADADEVVSADTGTLTVGQPLPAASAANQGWFVIVTEAGTPAMPAVLMQIGDWIVSTGAAWVHVPLYHTAITAANVGVTQINTHAWGNVQTALQNIYNLAANALSSVEVDDVSIIGDGTSGDPLEVAVVDGGVY
ncbi:MAG: hypothetical protein C5B54_00055 [Acidobacteria bacterium]|nr:MAG: hypothetical protein C5B54_00055 [Acidobacteriota bacterium]